MDFLTDSMSAETQHVKSLFERLDTSSTETEFEAQFRQFGLSPAFLADGYRLARSLQATREERLEALDRLQISAEDLLTAREAALQNYREFRATARWVFRETVVRITLGLVRKAPNDLEKFIVRASCTYGAVRHNPTYLRRLEPFCCLIAAERSLQDLIAALSAFERILGEVRLRTHCFHRLTTLQDAWINKFDRQFGSQAYPGGND